MIEIALEEYENLKRLSDPRQIALQRQQDQNRLNANIALQQQRAMERMQQTHPELHQALQNMQGQNYHYTQMIQKLQAMGMLPKPLNPNNRPPRKE